MNILTHPKYREYFMRLTGREPRQQVAIDYFEGGTYERLDFGAIQDAEIEVVEGDNFEGWGYLVKDGQRVARLEWGNVRFTAYPIDEKDQHKEKMKFDAFCDAFPEARLREVYRLVEIALLAGYDGELELRLVQRNNTVGAEPWLEAWVSNHLEWGNGWSRREAHGEIRWLTSSGHRVRFVLTRNAAGWDEIDLTRVEIGDDASEVFYPLIREICSRVGVECVVAPPPEEAGEQKSV